MPVTIKSNLMKIRDNPSAAYQDIDIIASDTIEDIENVAQEYISIIETEASEFINSIPDLTNKAVRTDITQTFTDSQKEIARNNIGVASTLETINYTATNVSIDSFITIPGGMTLEEGADANTSSFDPYSRTPYIPVLAGWTIVYVNIIMSSAAAVLVLYDKNKEKTLSIAGGGAENPPIAGTQYVEQDGYLRIATKTSDKDNAKIIIIKNKQFYTPEMFGATGTGNDNDSEAFQNCINNAIKDNVEAWLFNKYQIENIQVTGSLTIRGFNATLIPTYRKENETATNNMFNCNQGGDLIISGINFVGKFLGSDVTNINDNETYLEPLIKITTYSNLIIKDCMFKNIDGAFFPSQYPNKNNTDKFYYRQGQVIDIKDVDNIKIESCIFNHPSAQEAIWIMPKDDALKANIVYCHNLYFTQCQGQTPLNILATNITLTDIEYTSSCIFDGSAINCFGRYNNIDNIRCRGNYKSVIDCGEWGRFEAYDINVANLIIQSPRATAVAATSRRINISNCNLKCSSILTVSNYPQNQGAQDAWTTDFFPWLMTQEADIDARIVNVHQIATNGGDYPAVYINTNANANVKQSVSLENCEIDIINQVTKGACITVRNADININQCKITGYSYTGSTPTYNDNTVYICYLSRRNEILPNHISITNSLFDNTYSSPTPSKPHVLFLCYGLIKSARITNNVFTGYNFNTAIKGFYCEEIICKNNISINKNVKQINCAFSHCEADYPIAMGFKYIGDSIISNNNLSIAKGTVLNYNRTYNNAEPPYIGQIILLGNNALSVYRVITTNNANLVIPSTLVGASDDVGTTYVIPNVAELVLIAKNVENTNSISFDTQTNINSAYMGFTS